MVLVALTLVTGISTGFGLAFRLLYVLILTLVISFIWNWFTTRSIQVSIDRRTPRVSVGDEVEERLTVRNLSSFPKSTLEVEDLTDLPGYSAGRAISLQPKDFSTWRTREPARKRGVYTMGPVRVANSDAFGLFRREREYGGTDRLIVLPKIFDVSGFTASASYLSGESFAKERTHDLTPHAASVREYAFGDSISRIHWNSTARLGKLMSKEFDLGRSSDVWLFVDLHAMSRPASWRRAPTSTPYPSRPLWQAFPRYAAAGSDLWLMGTTGTSSHRRRGPDSTTGSWSSSP